MIYISSSPVNGDFDALAPGEGSGSENFGWILSDQLPFIGWIDPDRFKQSRFIKEYARDKWAKHFVRHEKHRGTIRLDVEESQSSYRLLPYLNGYFALREGLPGSSEGVYYLDPRGDRLLVADTLDDGSQFVLRQYTESKPNSRMLYTWVIQAYAPNEPGPHGELVGQWCYLSVFVYAGKWSHESYETPFFHGSSATEQRVVARPPTTAVADYVPALGGWVPLSMRGSSPLHVELDGADSAIREAFADGTIKRVRELFQIGVPEFDRAYDSTVYINAVERFRDPTTNLGEFFFGLKELPASVPAILGKASRYNATVIADLYLSWLYGLRPLPDDIDTVYQVGNLFKRLKKQMSGANVAAAKPITVDDFAGVCRVRIRLKEPVNTPIEERVIPDDGSTLRAGRLIGLATPITSGTIRNTLADSSIPVDVWSLARNVWELIPYSFVVDWFANVSGKLNDLEDIAYAQRMNVKYCEESICLDRTGLSKFILTSLQALFPGFRISGSVYSRVYERQYRRTVRSDITMRNITGRSFDHWWEAGALITVAVSGKGRKSGLHH